MIGNARSRCLSLLAVLLGALLQITTCQMSLSPPNSSGVSSQAVADVAQAFFGDFAREVLQAAIL
jgi:hypothetical protein